jgi:prophage tail gpP-like protein
MNLRIGNRIISKYNNIAVSLKYDAVGSTFAANVYFDPSNSDDRKTFIPGNYFPAIVEHNGETLITGVALSNGFKSAPTKQLMKLGGYSRAGVLDDCQFPIDNYSLQFSASPTLSEIANKLLAPFGILITIDAIVNEDCNTAYATSPIIEPDQTIKDFLTTLAAQKNIVLSHDTSGNLVFTRADTHKTPIFNFDGSIPVVDMDLSFDGQQMHNTITSLGQASIPTDNSTQDTIKNPYVRLGIDWMGTAKLNTLGQPGVAYSTGFRPGISKKTSGTDNDTILTARQLLAQELKAIKLTINIDSWTLNNTLVRPNNIITVTNPELFLYQKTRWFIESVDFRGDEKSETATLNCVLPECYNNDDVLNVFTGSNLTVPVIDSPGAHATITPFI